MMAVANIKIPHVQCFKDRHGKRRYYYRRRGYELAALPDPACKGFLEAYAKAANTQSEIGKAKTIYRSVGAAIVMFYQKPDFVALKPQTKKTYRGLLEKFRATHGDGSAVTIQTRHFDEIFAAMPSSQARILRKLLKSVFRGVVKDGWRRDNPVAETSVPKHKTIGFVPWSEEEIDQYRSYWPSGTRERLALELLLNTLVRRSDVILIGRQHIRNGRLTIVQTKTGEPVSVPILPELKAEIDQATLGMTFLVTQYGAPFTPVGFTNRFKEWAKKAGVLHRAPHGLRHAGGRRLAESGCTTEQIAAWLGHSSTREAETYTRDASKIRLTDTAAENLQRTKAGQPVLSNPLEVDINQLTSAQRGSP